MIVGAFHPGAVDADERRAPEPAAPLPAPGGGGSDADGDGDGDESKTPKWTRIFTVVSVLVAIAALVITVWSVGPGTLWSQITAIGIGFAAMLALEILGTSFDAAALSACLGKGGRRPSYLHVLRAQVAGRSINSVTPMASLGEATKATTLMQRTAPRRAIRGVFHYNLYSGGVRMGVVGLAAPLCALLLDLPRPLEIVLFAGGALSLVLVLVGALLVRRGMLVSAVDLGRRLRILPAQRAKKWRAEVARIDRYQSKDARPRSPWVPVAWLLASRLARIAQLWVVLASVGYIAGAGTITAISTAGSLIGTVSSIVPMGLGISEGSNAALFAALGAPAALGVTMVLGVRVTTLAFAVLGLTLVSATSAVEETARTVRQLRLRRAPPSVAAALRPDTLGASCELPACELPARADGASS